MEQVGLFKNHGNSVGMTINSSNIGIKMLSGINHVVSHVNNMNYKESESQNRALRHTFGDI